MTQKQQNQSDFDFAGKCNTCGIVIHSNKAVYDPGHFGNPSSLYSKCPKCGYSVEVEQTRNGQWEISIQR